MNYRIAEEKDFSELANMRWKFKIEEKDDNNQIKEEFIKECQDFFQQGHKDKSWTHWIAIDDDNTITSNISIHHIRKIPKPNRFIDEYGYVTNVYTKPMYRGLGIGTKLMNCVKEWAIKKDFEILIVWPSSKSIKFYERNGFNNENDVMELIFRSDD